jgi:hypothetical protein
MAALGYTTRVCILGFTPNGILFICLHRERPMSVAGNRPQRLGLSRGEFDKSSTDRGVAYLGDLQSLQSLAIENAQLTDEGVKLIVELE